MEPEPLSTLFGLKIVVQKPTPRMRLSERVNVSDDFRAEYNIWLLSMFGGDYILRPGCTVVIGNQMVVIRSDDYIKLVDHVRSRKELRDSLFDESMLRSATREKSIRDIGRMAGANT
jgi:hypothetical protein